MERQGLIFILKQTAKKIFVETKGVTLEEKWYSDVSGRTNRERKKTSYGIK